MAPAGGPPALSVKLQCIPAACAVIMSAFLLLNPPPSGLNSAIIILHVLKMGLHFFLVCNALTWLKKKQQKTKKQKQTEGERENNKNIIVVVTKKFNSLDIPYLVTKSNLIKNVIREFTEKMGVYVKRGVYYI